MNRRVIQFGNKRIGAGESIFVIAEAGLNHGGNLETAAKMIEAAAEAGADAIKFQAFRTEERFGIASEAYHLVKPTELNRDHFVALSKIADRVGIEFFATAFDEKSLQELVSISVPAIKIASCDICNRKLLRVVAQTGLPVILSRGTASEVETTATVELFREYRSPLALLHCVSSYPLEEISANLRAIHALLSLYDVPIGYSDHSCGIKIPLLAVYAGAMVIEKHFTLDRGRCGIDWEISAEPAELQQLINEIREAEHILGHGRIESLPCEAEEIAYRKQMRMPENDF
jgi:N-acetylneuraminate synthase